MALRQHLCDQIKRHEKMTEDLHQKLVERSSDLQRMAKHLVVDLLACEDDDVFVCRFAEVSSSLTTILSATNKAVTALDGVASSDTPPQLPSGDIGEFEAQYLGKYRRDNVKTECSMSVVGLISSNLNSKDVLAPMEKETAGKLGKASVITSGKTSVGLDDAASSCGDLQFVSSGATETGKDDELHLQARCVEDPAKVQLNLNTEDVTDTKKDQGIVGFAPEENVEVQDAVGSELSNVSTSADFQFTADNACQAYPCVRRDMLNVGTVESTSVAGLEKIGSNLETAKENQATEEHITEVEGGIKCTSEEDADIANFTWAVGHEGRIIEDTIVAKGNGATEEVRIAEGAGASSNHPVNAVMEEIHQLSPNATRIYSPAIEPSIACSECGSTVSSCEYCSMGDGTEPDTLLATSVNAKKEPRPQVIDYSSSDDCSACFETPTLTEDLVSTDGFPTSKLSFESVSFSAMPDTTPTHSGLEFVPSLRPQPFSGSLGFLAMADTTFEDAAYLGEVASLYEHQSRKIGRFPVCDDLSEENLPEKESERGSAWASHQEENLTTATEVLQGSRITTQSIEIGAELIAVLKNVPNSSPMQFWIQLVSSTEEFELDQDQIRGLAVPAEWLPCIDEYILCMSSQRWYRGCITDIVEDSYLVYLVDHGTTEQIQFNNLRPLPSHLQQQHAQVIPCQLNGYSKKTHSSEAWSFLNPGSTVKAVFVGRNEDDDSYTVDLILIDEAGNDIMSVVQLLEVSPSTKDDTTIEEEGRDLQTNEQNTVGGNLHQHQDESRETPVRKSYRDDWQTYMAETTRPVPKVYWNVDWKESVTEDTLSVQEYWSEAKNREITGPLQKPCWEGAATENMRPVQGKDRDGITSPTYLEGATGWPPIPNWTEGASFSAGLESYFPHKLPTLILDINSVHTAEFLEGTSPDDLYFQIIPSDGPIQSKLHSIYEKSEYSVVLPPSPKNNLCVVRHPQKSWCRARIVKYREELQEVECILLDFPEIITVDTRRLAPYHKMINSDPPYLVHVFMDKIQSKNANHWIPEEIEFAMNALNVCRRVTLSISDEIVTLKYPVMISCHYDGEVHVLNDIMIEAGLVLGIDEESVKARKMVEELKQAIGNPMAEHYYSARNSLDVDEEDAEQAIFGFKSSDPLELCRFYSQGKRCPRGDGCHLKHERPLGDGMATDKSAIYLQTFETVDLEVATRFTAHVSHIYSPKNFYVIDMEWWNKLYEFTEAFRSFYEKCAFRYKLQTVPALGELVAAKASDGEWYRMKIVEPDDVSHKGFLVDFGRFETVTGGNLRLIQPRFLHFPFMAIPCSLASISPVNEVFGPDASQRMSTIIDNRNLKAVVVERVFGEHVCLDLHFSDGSSLAEQLIKEGIAKRELATGSRL